MKKLVTQLRLKSKMVTLEHEKANLEKIALFSTTEGIVAVDKNNSIIFMNDRAKQNIPNPNALLDVMAKNGQRIIIEDCEAKLEYKKQEKISL